MIIPQLNGLLQLKSNCAHTPIIPYLILFKPFNYKLKTIKVEKNNAHQKKLFSVRIHHANRFRTRTIYH